MLVNIRNILLPLNGSGNLEAVMKVALDFARQFQAHLSAVVVGTDAAEMASLAGEGLSASMVKEIIDTAADKTHQRLLEVRACFDTLKERNLLAWQSSESGLGVVPNPAARPADAPVTATLDVMNGSTHDAITWRSRLADMTLVPNLAGHTDPRASETLHTILFDSGRPLVIAPSTVPEHVGRHLAIAWNGTAESSMALRCILPWAYTAERVTLLCSPNYQRIGPQADDALAYLRLHGINASSQTFKPAGHNVGTGLLEAVKELGADMLGMGAYSHSRLRQMILGGATRSILEHAEITVLMSR